MDFTPYRLSFDILFSPLKIKKIRFGAGQPKAALNFPPIFYRNLTTTRMESPDTINLY